MNSSPEHARNSDNPNNEDGKRLNPGGGGDALAQDIREERRTEKEAQETGKERGQI